MKTTEVWRENLATALVYAIASREEQEKRMGYTSNSALLHSWRDLLKNIKEGTEVITIVGFLS